MINTCNLSEKHLSNDIDRPNHTTIKAMKEGDKLIEKYMRDPSSVKTYNSVKEFIKAMKSR